MNCSSVSSTRPGAAIYNSVVLRFYDLWVLGFSNYWAWRCSTKNILLPFYRRHLSRRHLEVGAGSGYYLEKAPLHTNTKLTILDLNRHSLQVAYKRAAIDADCILGDAMVIGDILHGRVFDSIAMFYLLHCLPGAMGEKAATFSALKHHLSKDGILYGATILGDTANHNMIGRFLMRIYNRKGIFGNYDDTTTELARELSFHFRDVHVSRRGKVALFTARNPVSEGAWPITN